MEIGLRAWLIVIGIIIIVGILFDGWCRMRGGNGKLKFRLDCNISNLPNTDVDSDLLGPPRVLESHREIPIHGRDLPSIRAPIRESSCNRVGRGRAHVYETHQEGLNLDLDDVSSCSDHDKDLPDEASAKGSQRKSVNGPLEAEEVLVISVICHDTTVFKGPALLQNILESGLRFGDMDIFHRHESMSGNGEVLFSMANAVKPGTFHLDDIDLFSTTAVSFFIVLPGPRHPKQAFDAMLAAARKLSQELSGELRDDQRSVLTAQTIEHYRQRIVEFERRSLTQKR